MGKNYATITGGKGVREREEHDFYATPENATRLLNGGGRMKLKEFIEILQDESIDRESEVNYVIVYNPDKKYIRFELEETDE